MATDPTKSLRYYGGLTVLIFAIAPPLMLSLLAGRGNAPPAVWTLLAIGIPINLVAVYFAVHGMVGGDPVVAGRRIGFGCVLVAVGAILLLGGNALLG
jgi:hypothetical protein